MQLLVTHRMLCCVAVAAILSAAVYGLFDGASDKVAVSGRIDVDGQPLGGADVFFIPSGVTASQTQLSSDKLDASRPELMHGTTDAEGHYELAMGAHPGTYRVVVRGVVGGDLEAVLPGQGSDGVDQAQLVAAVAARMADSKTQSRSRRRLDPQLPRALPEQYSRLEQTVLEVDVPDVGTNAADLHLSMSATESARIAHAVR